MKVNINPNEFDYHTWNSIVVEKKEVHLLGNEKHSEKENVEDNNFYSTLHGLYFHHYGSTIIGIVMGY